MITTADIPRTARAALLTRLGAPIEVREVPVPTVEPGALLVRVEAATVCGTDTHMWAGHLPEASSLDLPIVLGHEMMGRVAAIGDGAETDSLHQTLSIGDRIVWSHGYCGQCYECVVLRQPTLCSFRRPYLYMRQNVDSFPYLTGGFAEYCYVFPQSGRVKVPDEVKDEWASAASCSMRTVMNGFELAGQIEPTDHVVIQGAGPLGLQTAAIAKHRGARRITVIGAPETRLEIARLYGATDTVSVEEVPDPLERDRIVRDGGPGADLVFECSGALSAVEEGLGLIRPFGTFIVLGTTSMGQTPVSVGRLVTKGATVRGVRSGHIGHYWKALEFMKLTRNEVDWDRMISATYSLDQVTEALRADPASSIKPVIRPWS